MEPEGGETITAGHAEDMAYGLIGRESSDTRARIRADPIAWAGVHRSSRRPFRRSELLLTLRGQLGARTRGIRNRSLARSYRPGAAPHDRDCRSASPNPLVLMGSFSLPLL